MTSCYVRRPRARSAKSSGRTSRRGFQFPRVPETSMVTKCRLDVMPLSAVTC